MLARAGRTVLVTGASSGIGKASVERFAAEGWNVVATMRKPDDAGAGSDNVFVTRLDVSDRESIDRAVAAGLERFGRIDALVNNAGYGQYGVFESLSRARIDEQFQVNVFGVMDVTRAILPTMREAKSGVIVNVSSGAGLFTLPLMSIYAASKFALEGFSESLAYELASIGIAVKIVEPHGGVGETRFNERAASSGGDGAVPPAYLPFVQRSMDAFATMSSGRTIVSADVAGVIFEAATDGTDRLRYLVGDDARGFIKARRELDEESYVRFMRRTFSDRTSRE